MLHTHLGMKGSWRVRPAERPWDRSPAAADVVIEAGDHHAACFGAPLVELRAPGSLIRTEGARRLDHLGPDAATAALDSGGLQGVVARSRAAARRRPGLTVGELLLDQSVLAGIGNVYRCEALFAEGVFPFLPAEAVDDQVVSRLFARAADLLRSNLGARGAFGGPGSGRDTGLGPGRAWVHGRAGRPCRRGGTRVRSALLGRPGGTPRIVYWCSRCQAGPGDAGTVTP